MQAMKQRGPQGVAKQTTSTIAIKTVMCILVVKVLASYIWRCLDVNKVLFTIQN